MDKATSTEANLNKALVHKINQLANDNSIPPLARLIEIRESIESVTYTIEQLKQEAQDE